MKKTEATFKVERVRLDANGVEVVSADFTLVRERPRSRRAQVLAFALSWGPELLFFSLATLAVLHRLVLFGETAAPLDSMQGLVAVSSGGEATIGADQLVELCADLLEEVWQ